MTKEHIEYKNSLRLFCIFVGGFLLVAFTPIYSAFFGGIGMVYSVLGIIHNAYPMFLTDNHNKTKVAK